MLGRGLLQVQLVSCRLQHYCFEVMLRVVLMALGTLTAVSAAQLMTNPAQDLQRALKGQPGTWSAWSAWSVCSRSCGGGITTQTRQCSSKPLGRHRRRVHSVESQHHCIGLYKRIHICNTKECPGTTDFRQEQCSRYNGQQFLGRAYDWEPFLDAPAQCALNCRARGFRFYATLNATVEDGTPCRGYILGHDSDRWVCIAGQCKHVGCDGVVGSDQRYDGCGVCGGDNSTCRLVSGLFTKPELPVGYNLITRIPQAACNLSITELKQSRNYLALRMIDGTFILNGNWAINWTGEFDSLGTKFFYRRKDENTAESITSTGPLAEPVDLMLIYQQPNPGIKYQYHLPVVGPSKPQTAAEDSAQKQTDLVLQPSEEKEQPKTVEPDANDNREKGQPFSNWNSVLSPELQGYSGDEAAKPKPKGKKRKFVWKISGLSKCSKPCGGGLQTALLACFRENDRLRVANKRCASLERPTPQVTRCNLKPCVAKWVVEEWGECSVSCGDGVQQREIVCRQEITPSLTMTVAEGACLTPPSAVSRTRPCKRSPCLGGSTHWAVGAWTQCSAKCGQGVQTRNVYCPAADCNEHEKPVMEAVCYMPPCQGQKHSQMWFYTDWSQDCSEGCGTGVQQRNVLCLSGSCEESARPEHQRACFSDKLCGATWLTGPWSQCSSSCGWGRQSRSVVCITKTQGQQFVSSDDKCPTAEKPATEQQCKQQDCGPEWFMSDWSQCSRPCDTGAQRRDVRCIVENQQMSTGCNETNKPPSRRSCNIHKCPVEEEQTKAVQSNESLRDQPRPLDTDTANSIDGSDCKDKFRNCPLVVQARLCKYKYYRMSCCQACHNKQL